MQPYKMRMLPYKVDVDALQTSFPTPANPNRNYLYIQNQGLNPVSVVFGGKAAADTANLIIGSGGDYTWDQAIPIEAISLFSTAGTTVYILEGNPP